VARSLVERRLSEVAAQLKQVRQDLAIADEQLAQLADEADDARIRALVSETPLAERDHRQAQRHAEAMAGHRSDLVADLQRLELAQDDLLDRFMEEQRRR
jgi:hypothetical protein